ncbi:ADH_N domain-containing protein [Caenorhabditis elegans]|uniref:ADH_N domain-containing protein n=1 Tax=Caenorhabditis elegans TaxID=6239 RepID=Q20504_CAEEL|nr:ADH_N domain-containing protein [Caenorhabditis elegans]CAA91984.1 ADH_N domain-containing protein [Caenorhabditis elegans]|eukprot:NP_509818.1 Uncharacterized protein CELE_F47B10.4 [Caenorhabditis elegans]
MQSKVSILIERVNVIEEQPVKLQEFDDDVYPGIVIAVEQTSFFARCKKVIVNTVVSMTCGVSNIPYSFFARTNQTAGPKPACITINDLPPV